MKTTIKSFVLGLTFAGILTGVGNAETTKFSTPLYKGYHLDWCVDWGKIGCGKRVSENFCKIKGYQKSVGYKKWEKPGKPTRLIGNDSICDADYCDSFHFIMCER